MSRTTVGLIAGGVVLVLGVGWYAAQGQEGGRPQQQQGAAKDEPRKGDDGPGKAQRLVYVVRYGSAKDLAGALSQHFKGVAEVQALPEPGTNCLLISSAPSAHDEIVKTLEQIDRRPRMVAVEVLVAEVSEGRKDGADKSIDERELSGPADAVLAKVQDLQKKGQL